MPSPTTFDEFDSHGVQVLQALSTQAAEVARQEVLADAPRIFNLMLEALQRVKSLGTLADPTDTQVVLVFASGYIAGLTDSLECAPKSIAALRGIHTRMQGISQQMFQTDPQRVLTLMNEVCYRTKPPGPSGIQTNTQCTLMFAVAGMSPFVLNHIEELRNA